VQVKHADKGQDIRSMEKRQAEREREREKEKILILCLRSISSFDVITVRALFCLMFSMFYEISAR